jgi:DNA adenine methylase
VHSQLPTGKLPDASKSSRGDATALGLDADRRRPELSAANGRGDTTANASAILAWFVELERRLRRVRVVCGDWTRVCTPAVTHGIGLTAVFLDPPYSRDAGRTAGIYSEDDDQVAHRVREWAIENGGNQDLRIALCGYEGEHEMPPSWTRFEWAAQGGYANQRKSGDGYANRLRERIYFSPHCLGAVQERLIA